MTIRNTWSTLVVPDDGTGVTTGVAAGVPRVVGGGLSLGASVGSTVGVGLPVSVAPDVAAGAPVGHRVAVGDACPAATIGTRVAPLGGDGKPGIGAAVVGTNKARTVTVTIVAMRP